MDRSRNPRNNIIFLLGAGASKAAGLKTSVGLFESVVGSCQMINHKHLRLALRHVAETIKKSDPGANVEDLLDAARAIRNRDQSYLWLFANGLRKPLKDIEPEVLSVLSRIILDHIREELTTQEKGAFHPYLWELVQLAQRSSTPCIFTLNYDLLIESVLEAKSIRYSTGFIKPVSGAVDSFILAPNIEYWPVGYQRVYVKEEMTKFSPDLTPADVRLIKLHGSLDWYRVASRAVYEGGWRLSPQDRIMRSKVPPDGEKLEMLIAGRSGKERLEEPFSVLLREFHLAVQKADVIVVIGYSFSDEHINRVLIDAQVFERPRSFDLVVVNGPNWPQDEQTNETMSKAAKYAWPILVQAARKTRAEYLYGLAVLPFYAEQALLESHLSKKLEEVLDVRRHGL